MSGASSTPPGNYFKTDATFNNSYQPKINVVTNQYSTVCVHCPDTGAFNLYANT